MARHAELEDRCAAVVSRASSLVLISWDLGYRVGVKARDAVLRRQRGADTALSARYCVDVWRQHRVAVGVPRVLLELGPGASTGVGVAAIAGGVGTYTALDNIARADASVDPGFASAIAAAMGTDVPSDLDDRIRYVAPWCLTAVPPESVDAAISQAVKEHVADLPGTYAAIARWLRPGGVTSQQIDFRSHAISPWWNGHLRYPDDLWKRLKGRSDPINRQPLAAHLTAIEAAGLRITRLEVGRRHNRIPRAQLAARFHNLSEDDLSTASAFIVAERPRELTGGACA